MLENVLEKYVSQNPPSNPLICYNSNGRLVMTKALSYFVDNCSPLSSQTSKKAEYKKVYGSLSTFLHNPPTRRSLVIKNDEKLVNNGIDYELLKEAWNQLKTLDPNDPYLTELDFQ